MIKILLMIFVLCFPLNVSANSNIHIVCDKTNLYNNEITECNLEITEENYIITNVSAQIIVNENLEIISSSYDDKNWLMLDSKFNVKDINLISESNKKKDNNVIATFKVKAINKKDSLGTIAVKNIKMGDSDYLEHEEKIDNILLTLNYDNKNEVKIDIHKKISIIIVSLVLFIIFMGLFIYIKRSKRR